MRGGHRIIAVVTGSRAEFGLLEPVVRALAERSAHRGAVKIIPRVIVTGTHLTTKTWRDVREAGFRIEARVPMQRASATGRAADVAALGRGVIGLGRVFASMKPDVVLVLGDRIEVLAAASAASVGGLHLAHIHGGDRAEGVADEAIRHAVSKMAHLHFAATSSSRKRLVRMGECPSCVFNVGSPAADGLAGVEPAGDAPTLIVMQHPAGARDADEQRWMRQTLRATSRFDRLVLAPNSDPGCRGVRAALKACGVPVVPHLPRGRFLALLAGARAIVGNSSAGLIEAAVLKKPCVNIGPRQQGRQKPANVTDCDYGQRPVRAAIRVALSADLRRMRHPYGTGQTGERIAELLATLDLTRVPTHKHNTY